jgi:two-component system, chemotaxis family, sensor kinase Cph1
MGSGSLNYPDKVDLDNCAKEPIHIIGKTQSHGLLIVCDPETLEIVQCGKNAEAIISIPYDELPGKKLSEIVGEKQAALLRESKINKEQVLPQEMEICGNTFLLHSHISEASLVIDLEPVKMVQDPFFFQKELTGILNTFQATPSIAKLVEAAASRVKQMFGYDRVMIYRFDENWNGEVIAESKEEEMDSWLGLHYPATDIPAQSRELFLKHRVRLISNVNYEPVPITPELSPLTSRPLDISKSHLRAVSPIHIEYLQNMEVGASLSAAIVVKGKLWGLIACHHREAKFLDHYQRESCRFLSQMLASEITLHDSKQYLEKAETTEVIRQQLFKQMQDQEDIPTALQRGQVKFTSLVPCEGGALLFEGQWHRVGNTPEEEQLNELVNSFLSGKDDDIIQTRNLSSVYPQSFSYKETASGILSLRIADDKYLLWFKPEVIQTVSWGGNPHDKAYYNDEKNRISPRKSFQKWTEELTGISEEWQDIDISNIKKLRDDVTHILLAKQRKEIEALNEKLVEANKELELFSYGLSHDLRAPLRGIDGYLTVIREDFGDQLEEEGLMMLKMTKALGAKMNQLIDDILAYSGLNHAQAINFQPIVVNELIDEVLDFVNVKNTYSGATIKIQEDLPVIEGDRRMLFQLWSNLLTNALKYSEKEKKSEVEVGTTVIDGISCFYVRDNGIGIKEEHLDKIFKTFTRVAGGKFQGSGIGLAIVKRIVEKHRGKIWVESVPNEGSVFYFCINCEETAPEVQYDNNSFKDTTRRR